MSFDEMWGQARDNALTRQQSSTRLNQLAPSGGSAAGGESRPQLDVDAGVLGERAKNAETVHKNFMEADDKVMRATSDVTLKGFKSDSALEVFQKRWRSQMRYLENLLEKGVKGNLHTAAAEFKAEEARRVTDVNRLDKGREKN